MLKNLCLALGVISLVAGNVLLLAQLLGMPIEWHDTALLLFNTAVMLGEARKPF